MRYPDPEDPKYWDEGWGPEYGRWVNFHHKEYFRDFRKWKAELRQTVYQIEHEPAHEGYPRSRRYMEGWLDGVRFTLKKLENLLGEEVSGGSVTSQSRSVQLIDSKLGSAEGAMGSREPVQNKESLNDES